MKAALIVALIAPTLAQAAEPIPVLSHGAQGVDDDVVRASVSGCTLILDVEQRTHYARVTYKIRPHLDRMQIDRAHGIFGPTTTSFTVPYGAEGNRDLEYEALVQLSDTSDKIVREVEKGISGTCDGTKCAGTIRAGHVHFRYPGTDGFTWLSAAISTLTDLKTACAATKE